MNETSEALADGATLASAARDLGLVFYCRLYSRQRILSKDWKLFMPMKRLAFVLTFILAASAWVAAGAQVTHSATARQFSVTAGGMASAFQPDFAGEWAPPDFTNPVPQTSNNWLFGVGAYVDVRFSHWVQLEAEGRWQRFNQYDGIHQDNYLIGPRVPIHRLWKGTVYGKALVGLAQMSCTDCTSGHYTDFAFGGGMDMKLSKHISFRAVDAEYQYCPNFGTSSLSPYGVSMGIGYKFF